MEENKIINGGNIKISEEVISTIASIAVSEIDGVHGMGGSFAGDIAEILGKKSMTKGVKVNMNEKEVALDLNVVLKYGVRIPEVAWNIQENVKKSVESMTGLEVSKINIHVVGIEFSGSEALDNNRKITVTPVDDDTENE